MRWVVLDEIAFIEKKRMAKTISHVPNVEYSAEVLMIEMMAQTAALVLGAETDYKKDVIFAKIDNAIFMEPPQANSTIEIEASAENVRAEGSWFDSYIKVRGRIIAQARLLLLNVGHLVEGKTEPVSFHRGFMKHFNVREKIR